LRLTAPFLRASTGSYKQVKRLKKPYFLGVYALFDKESFDAPIPKLGMADQTG